MATLKDISRAVGLSVTQVSRALNGHSDVNQETRQRVEEAAKSLNYHPNISARKLVTGQSNIVGLVMAEEQPGPSDGLFVQMVRGLSRYFSERHVQFVLHIADPREDMVKVHERLFNGGAVGGFLVIDPRLDDPRIRYLTRRNIPFVVHGRDRPAPEYAFFDIDNEAVGYRLTAHLAQSGHKRIAFINGVAGQGYAEARKSGHLRALNEYGCEINEMHHIFGPMSDSAGLLGTVRLFDGRGPKPTAIICCNTLIAKGVYTGLSALQLSVPKDVSVIVHDDHMPASTLGGFVFPHPMTGTVAPLNDGWLELAALLERRMDGVPTHDLQRFGDVSLVIGRSCEVLTKAV